jgi:hypothetical protein
MSLRYEQCYALYKTREFLRDLLSTDTRPKTVKELKDRAYSCLKHFPFLKENGEPIFSQDDFPCPPIKRYEQKPEDEHTLPTV